MKFPSRTELDARVSSLGPRKGTQKGVACSLANVVPGTQPSLGRRLGSLFPAGFGWASSRGLGGSTAVGGEEVILSATTPSPGATGTASNSSAAGFALASIMCYRLP